MKEQEDLSALIGSVYDAAMRPSAWPDVLREMAEFVGGQAAGLLLGDAESRSAQCLHTFGVAPHYVRLYYEEYARLDPTVPALFSFDIGQVVSVAEILPYDEFLRSRFYKEWARPQGWVDSAQIILEKSPTGFALVSFLRHEAMGPVDAPMRLRAELIVPHLRRAVQIGKAVDFGNAEAAMLSDTIDRLRAAMFLVDARGRVVRANVSGQALLKEGSPLRVAGGRLVACDAAADEALRDVFLAAGSGDVTGGKCVGVPLASADGESFVAHVMPLISGQRRRAGEHYSAVAALIVQPAEPPLPAAPETLGKCYNLTPSEVRVLLAIVQLGGTPETARALGINETTVRTHLQRVFAKTGTSRQAGLVKLVAGFSDPFIGRAED